MQNSVEQGSRHKSKKKYMVAGILGAFAIISGGVIGCRYNQYSNGIYPKHTTINGIDVSGLTISETINMFEQKSNDLNLSVAISTEQTVQLKNEYVTFSYDDTEFFTPFQNGFLSYLKETKPTLEVAAVPNYSEADIATNLHEELSAYQTLTASDAYIEKTDDGFVLHEEICGDEIDTSILAGNMVKIFSNMIGVNSSNVNNYAILISTDGCHIEPSIVSSDLQEYYDKLDAIQSWSITYDTGEILDKNYFLPYVNLYDGKIVIDDSFISLFVSNLAKSHDSIGIERTFQTTSSGEVKISGGTYGWKLNQDAEVEELKELFNRLESQEGRTPSYLQTAKTNEGNEIGDTYIEISLSKQHVWYYKDGKLIMDSDCVTGTQGLKDTPTGVYFISECIDGKYLSGDDYKTWVNKWMRLTNSGIALYDATWRNEFGGNIYKTSGSHGCINLPLEFATQLFDEIEVNTPAVIY